MAIYRSTAVASKEPATRAPNGVMMAPYGFIQLRTALADNDVIEMVVLPKESTFIGLVYNSDIVDSDSGPTFAYSLGFKGINPDGTAFADADAFGSFVAGPGDAAGVFKGLVGMPVFQVPVTLTVTVDTAPATFAAGAIISMALMCVNLPTTGRFPTI